MNKIFADLTSITTYTMTEEEARSFLLPDDLIENHKGNLWDEIYNRYNNNDIRGCERLCLQYEAEYGGYFVFSNLGLKYRLRSE